MGTGTSGNFRVRVWAILRAPGVYRFLLGLAFLIACNGPGAGGPEFAGDAIAGPAAEIPREGDRAGFPRESAPPAIGSTCRTSDPEKLCLGLKYVVYKNADAEPIVSELEALSNVGTINQLWGQCKIGFQVDQFVTPDPADYELRYRTTNMSELDGIRNAFADDRTLLLVTTGTWDRSGSLGNSGANAWTAMPGGPPYGAILEKPVATYSVIIAHELGHYLNLLHAADTSLLMNPVIYRYSTKISSSDCSKARSAARYFWSKMLR